MKIAVIPARGGSKRIPRKNIKQFCGKPMIAWSIEAALSCDCFDQVIVSTDDEEIAEVAFSFGAAVPFMRPPELADDHTGTTLVMRHAIEQIGHEADSGDLVCCIYATAPFLQRDDISCGLQMMQKNDCDYAFSVTSFGFPIQRAIRITPESRVEMFQPDNFDTRSQDLEEAFHDAGQFYWGRSEAWLEGRKIFGIRSMPVMLPRYRVQDIDTMEDWVRAELLFRALQSITI
jgi:N-acylneuraminate cytidylyltransferase